MCLILRKSNFFKFIALSAFQVLISAANVCFKITGHIDQLLPYKTHL